MRRKVVMLYILTRTMIADSSSYAQFFLLIVAIALCLLSVFKWYKKPKQFPPGPRGIPFFGTLPLMGLCPEKALKKWSEVYGSIMSVRFGSMEVVVLNDFDSTYQTYVQQSTAFASRPYFPGVQLFTGGCGLGTLPYGKKWKKQRKFGSSVLKRFGMGKLCMESMIQNEASCLSNKFRTKSEKAFDPSPEKNELFSKDSDAANKDCSGDIIFICTSETKKALQLQAKILENAIINELILLHFAVANIVCKLSIGKRFDYDDEIMTEFLKNYVEAIEDPFTNAAVSLFTVSPFLARIPPLSYYLKKIILVNSKLLDILRAHIEDHKETFDKENIRDFVDAFLNEMHNKTDESFSEQQLVQYLRDLFGAGTDTTAGTLNWALLCLIHHPNVQTKIREEIANVFGSNGVISWNSRVDLPYTCAFMEEVFRYRTLIPLGFPHATTSDAKIGKYIIPKGTMVLSNVWAVHNDMRIWDKPETFNPERFINDKGEFVSSKHLIAFSMGRRQCMGENMGRMEFFIFLVTLVRHFVFIPDPESKELPNIIDGSQGIIFIPKRYKIVAKDC